MLNPIISCLVILSILISGCASVQKDAPRPAEAERLAESEESDSVELDPLLHYQALYLESELVNEQAMFHDLISPKHFSNAQKSLDRVFHLISRNGSEHEVEAELLKAESSLVEMTMPIILSEIFLFDVFDARQDAVSAGAHERPEFEKADEMLRQMGQELEAGIVTDILDEKLPIIHQYETAHTIEVQDRELADTLRIFRQAEKIGAARYFPEIHERVRMKVEEARASIAKYRNHPEGYRDWVEDAEFSANRLLSLTDSAQWISKGNPAEIASAWESFLQRMALQLDLSEIRHLPQEQQMSALLDQMESLGRDTASTEADEESAEEVEESDPVDREQLENPDSPRGYPRLEKPVGPLEEKPTNLAKSRIVPHHRGRHPVERPH